MSQPLLFVIVLNNNRPDDTLACLASLYKDDYEPMRVILLDNCSPAGAMQTIGERFPQVQLVPLTSNLGYAGNNNIGIRLAMEQGAEWMLILNDDTILDPQCLSLLMEAGETDTTVGILGPMVYHLDEPDVIQSAGGMLGKHWRSIHLGKDERDRGQFPAVQQVEWISGCAILVRRAVVEQVGLLDADYFLYWEETDWCIRAARAGWKILQVPQAKLWHKGVQRNYQPKPYVTYYSTRNYLFTLAKHHAPFSVRAIAFLNIVRTLVSWSLKPRWRSKREHRDAMWHGMIDFLRHRMGPMISG